MLEASPAPPHTHTHSGSVFSAGLILRWRWNLVSKGDVDITVGLHGEERRRYHSSASQPGIHPDLQCPPHTHTHIWNVKLQIPVLNLEPDFCFFGGRGLQENPPSPSTLLWKEW